MENCCVSLFNASHLRVFNLKDFKSVGKINIPENDINCFNFIFNYQALVVTTIQDNVFILDIQNWNPLSILFTKIDNSIFPKNQISKHIDSKMVDFNKSIVSLSFSDGTVCTLEIYKSEGKISNKLIDKFNMFEYHISKSDDIQIAQLYQNLTNYRVKYLTN